MLLTRVLSKIIHHNGTVFIYTVTSPSPRKFQFIHQALNFHVYTKNPALGKLVARKPDLTRGGSASSVNRCVGGMGRSISSINRFISDVII